MGYALPKDVYFTFLLLQDLVFTVYDCAALER